MPATSNKAITGPDFPSWSRPVADGTPDGLNVGGLRARTADTAAIAPVTAYLRLPDGTRVRLVVAGVEPGRQEFAVVGELPAGWELVRADG